MIGKPSFNPIVVDVNPSFLPIAKEKAKEMGALKNSITEGDGNEVAFIGEQVAADYHSIIWVNERGHNYDYDVMAGKVKIDVKATSTNYSPLPHYFAKVCAKNIKQKCDYYYFVRVMYDFSKAWLVGWMEKELYLKNATYYKKGDLDPSSNKGWRFPESCYVMELKDLKPINGKVLSY